MRSIALLFLSACAAPRPTPSDPALRMGAIADLDPYLNFWSSIESDVVGAGFGGSAAVGDVNGDGYDDVLVGATGFDNGQTDEGQASVFLGSADGLESSAIWSEESNQSGAILGVAVATADVDGDGYAEVLLGAPLASSGQTGEGQVSLHAGTPTGPSVAEIWSAESNNSFAWFGQAITSGDVNGDGFADVFIGAPSYSNGEPSEGRVYGYLGSATGLGVAEFWRIEPNQLQANLGRAIASADFNGDGYDDLAVGVPFWTATEFRAGRAIAYHGSSTGLALTPAWTVDGVAKEAYFGDALGAGDVNGDGFGDLIVGASAAASTSLPGEVNLYLGSAAGLSTLAAWSVEGDRLLAGLGSTLAVADLDADGYDDVLIGAAYYANGEDYEGAAFLYRGSASGLEAAPTWWAEGDEDQAVFGATISTGDVNGDGRSDVVFGVASHSDGEDGEGRIDLHLGGCVGHTVDTDGDGVPDECDVCAGADDDVYDADHDGACAPAVGDAPVDCDGADPYVYPGAPERCDGKDSACAGVVPDDEIDVDGDGRFACAGDFDDDPLAVMTSAGSVSSDLEGASLGYVVASAGDLNGDGFDDAIVGGFGIAQVYLGSAAGLSWVPAWSQESTQIDDDFGVAVAGAGDVNGDGYDDVLVGAPLYDNGQFDEGAAFLYLGDATGLGANPAWSAEPDQSFASFGVALGSAGDVNGDGYDDVIIGAPDVDGGQSNEGRAYLYLGSAAGLGAAPAWTTESNQAQAHLGQSLGAAGDVNGDGFDDVIVSAYAYSNPDLYEGRVEVFLGSATGLAAVASWSAEGDQVGIELGGYGPGSAGSAGDVNGDGYGDVIVGGSATATESYAGQARVYLGSAAGLDTAPAWTTYGDGWIANYGWSVAGLGDVDGDGRSDIAVGAPMFRNGEYDEGRVYLYLGTRSGPDAADVWTAESDHAFSYFGQSVAGADVNGDGYADLIVGGYGFEDGVADEGGLWVYLGADGVDTDGDGMSDVHDGCPGVDDLLFDADADGWCTVSIDGAATDCDDANAEVYPGAPEVCDGLDTDCDGVTPAEEADADLDGAPACVDCDDDDGSTYPGAPELCDGVANSCGALPSNEADLDGDGVRGCAGDCDDLEASVYPGAPELCDGQQNACAGLPLDEADADGDGMLACQGDCDDEDATAYAGAPELCDGVDNACAGAVSADEADQDLDGYRWCAGDCDDGAFDVHPGAPELCDGVANTCGALPPDEADLDADGMAACAGDCDDGDATTYLGAPEACDAIDNDCDGAPDNGVDYTDWYPDADQDGYGDAEADATPTCDGAPPQMVADHSDCDDARADVHPEAVEICDDRDNTCDGVVDERCDAPKDEPGPTCGCGATPSTGGLGGVLWVALWMALRRSPSAAAGASAGDRRRP